MDSTTNFQEIKDAIKAYCDERDWDQFHNVKDF